MMISHSKEPLNATLCKEGFIDHRKYKGVHLPIKILNPDLYWGVKPDPMYFEDHQVYVLPGGHSVYFVNDEIRFLD